MCFLMNFVKFLRTPFLTEHLWWLLLWVFFLFLIWFPRGTLMEINSTHVYFRSRIMLCFNYEKQKDKNTFKYNSQSEDFIYWRYCLLSSSFVLFIDVIICYWSSFVLFLKTRTRDVSSGVIFLIRIEQKSFQIIWGRHSIVVLIN